MAYEDLIENGKATRFKSGDEAARECGSIGGIKSGESRRRKRSLREAAELVMALPVNNKRLQNKLKKMGIDLEDADNQTAVIVGLLEQSLKGNPKTAALLFDLLDDDGADTNGQTESHNALIDAIRKRHDED